MYNIQTYLNRHSVGADTKVRVDNLIVYKDSIAVWMTKTTHGKLTTKEVVVDILGIGDSENYIVNDASKYRCFHILDCTKANFAKVIERAQSSNIEIHYIDEEQSTAN